VFFNYHGWFETEVHSEGFVGGVKQTTTVCLLFFRLDGNGFSKLIKKLRQIGVFGPGFSPEFGEIMQEACQLLMQKARFFSPMPLSSAPIAHHHRRLTASNHHR